MLETPAFQGTRCVSFPLHTVHANQDYISEQVLDICIWRVFQLWLCRWRANMCCNVQNWRMRSALKNLHGLSPQANFTDRATAACRRSDCQLLRIHGQRDGSLWPYSRFSRQKAATFLSSSSSVVLTRLSGPRSRPTNFFLVVPGIEPEPPDL
jgi:hypothetical protein